MATRSAEVKDLTFVCLYGHNVYSTMCNDGEQRWKNRVGRNARRKDVGTEDRKVCRKAPETMTTAEGRPSLHINRIGCNLRNDRPPDKSPRLHLRHQF
ncbi:hypothetical protein F2P81_002996 [Scophthalmus maximus]|uniref:Uncharacterized protein n=1 Tax=Scophthalmus maximus TaxID=52904 RepID=A0A6A4THA4_SCOMX|nr:hypothetical protein F2P81_002996 [Scophthalmus maximus]